MTSRVDQARLDLLAAIETGSFRPDERLPGERDLAVRFGISRTTLRKVLDGLVREGRLEARHGLGTFLKAAPRIQPELVKDQWYSLGELLREQGRATRFDLVWSGAAVATADERVAFAAHDAPLVQRMIRHWFAETEGIAVESVATPLRFPSEVSEAEPSITAVQRRVRSMPLDAQASQMLAQPVGTTGLLVEELAFGADGRCCRTTRLTVPADRLDMAFGLEQVPARPAPSRS